MPNYTYVCKGCGVSFDMIRKYDERKNALSCGECGGEAEWTFPITSNIWGGISYHDESLGVDIHGRRHRQEVMKAMNVIEAGDPKNGSRNFEKTRATGILPEQGIKLSDVQRAQERARKRQEEKVVTVISKEKGERSYRHGDLKGDGKKFKAIVT